MTPADPPIAPPEPAPVRDTPERALAAFAMAALCLVTFANVAARYLTDVSFAFTEEYSIFLMVVMTFLGASAAVAADRHIRITVLVDRLPAVLRRPAEAAAWLAMLAVFGILAWYGGRLAYDQWRFEETSPALGNPQWLYTVWMPLLSVVAGARVLARLARVVRGTAGG